MAVTGLCCSARPRSGARAGPVVGQSRQTPPRRQWSRKLFPSFWLAGFRVRAATAGRPKAYGKPLRKVSVCFLSSRGDGLH